MKVFLDANVLVSVLNKEYPVFTYSSRILSLTSSSDFEMYTSPLCLAIAFYFSTKKSGQQKAKSKIKLLTEHLQLAMINREAVLQAVNHKSIYDLEDGFQYFAALREDCSCIVTEDRNDFFFSKIPVVNCEQFLSTYLPSK